MSNLLLSVDPGADKNKCACALHRDRSLVRYDTVDLSTTPPEEWGLVVWEFLGELLPEWRGVYVVVEGQWLVRGVTPSRFRSVELLVECRKAWETACNIAGALVQEAARPQVWIPAVSKGAPGKTAEDRVKFVCEQRYPGKVFTKDEACAVMLGQWWITRYNYPPMEER
jgi:hypothetical protein